MKTSLRAALTILALPIFWTNPSHADESSSKAVAHRVTLAPVNGYVVEAEPSDPPSSTHREGTIFALVRTDAAATSNLVELDVKTGAELHRAPLACTKILREKSSVFAMCGDEVVELDRTLAPVTRYATRRCAAGSERRDIKLVADHANRVVALYMCASRLQLTIVDTTAQRVRSNVSTNLFPYAHAYYPEQTNLFFRGTNIQGVVPGMPLGPYEIFALSPDDTRVVRTIVIGDGEWLRDDGAHLHLSLTQESLDLARSLASSDPDGKAPRPTPPRRNPWLTLGRDFTLSDALTPLSSEPIRPEPASPPTPPPPKLPNGLGGDGLRYTFVQGDVTFYMTFTCCGSGKKGGLYAAPPAVSGGR